MSPASATFPGTNGDIVYIRDGEVRAMAVDGSGDHLYTALTARFEGVSFSSGATKAAVIDYTKHGDRIVLLDLVHDTKAVVLRPDHAPTEVLSSVALSPKGTRVAFTDGQYPRRLYTVRADGSHLTRIANGYDDVDWGSNGRLVASHGIFAGDGKRLIVTMDPDGDNKTIIATFPAVKGTWRSVWELAPSWSPDCRAVVFAGQRHHIIPDVWLVNSDGSGFQRLTRTSAASESNARFSPDGTTIVFSREKGSNRGDLWTMDADGGHKTQRTDTPDSYEYTVAWLPA
jgi:Tol biopolymer transport system component